MDAQVLHPLPPDSSRRLRATCFAAIELGFGSFSPVCNYMQYLILWLCVLARSHSLGEPLSPQSDARAKGLHYTVKERRYGYECLNCGLLGDISYIKASPCKPFLTTSPNPQEEAWQHQMAMDEKMAQELQQLQQEEAELEQLILLQQLEEEELKLQELLNEQRALAIVEKLEKQRQAPNPSDSKPSDAPPPIHAADAAGGASGPACNSKHR